MGAGVLDAIARLIGELAEIYLQSVVRLRQHPYVRPGAEHPLVPRGHNHRPNFGMLEPQPLHGVIQLDVHSQVIRVQLEVISGIQRRILLHPQRQPGHRAFHFQLPVPVLLRGRGEVYATVARFTLFQNTFR